MARSGQPGRTRSFKASCIDRLIVGAVDGSQGEPRRPNHPNQARWSQLGTPLAPENASRPSQERLGSVLGRPWNAPAAPRGSPRSPQGAKRRAREHPGACRGDENRGWVALEMENIELFSRGSLGKRRRSDATSSFYDVASFCQACEPSKVCLLYTSPSPRD